MLDSGGASPRHEEAEGGLNHSALHVRLKSLGADISPSELHGIISGVVCAGRDSTSDPWLEGWCDRDRGPGSGTVKACREEFLGLCELVELDLDDPQMGFAPLLPADVSPLTERATALASWCRGFLSGVGATEGKARCLGSGDVGEILGDFAEISRLDSGMSDDEESERAFAELLEYVRVAVLLVRETCRPEATAASTGETYERS